MSYHAKYSPSDASRWMNCPGAVAFTANIPDNETEYAAEGTLAHKLLELCLTEGVRAETYLGHEIMTFDNPDFQTEVDEDMVHHIQNAIDYLAGRIDEYDEAPEIFSEMRVHVSEDVHGTGDVFLWWKKRGLIECYDLKYGRGKMVEASSLQQAIYLIGFVNDLYNRDTMRTDIDLNTLDLMATIHQPRGHHADGPIRHHTYDWDKLLALAFDIEVAVGEAEQADAPRIPGEAQCMWCPGRATCPERTAKAVTLTRKAFDVMQSSPPGSLADDDVVFLLENRDEIIDILNTVADAHLQRVLQEGPLLGYKAIEGRSQRRWVNDNDDTIELLRKKLKLRKADVVVEKAIGIPAAEKMVKGDAEKLAALAELYVKPEGKPKLVPIDAAGKSVGPMFEKDHDFLH